MADINVQSDVGEGIDKYMKKGLLSADGFSQINIQINNVLNHPQIKHLFKSDVKVFSEYKKQLRQKQIL